MPYSVKKGSGVRPWKVVRADTGKVVGSSFTKEHAQASMRARYAAEAEAKTKPKKKA